MADILPFDYSRVRALPAGIAGPEAFLTLTRRLAHTIGVHRAKAEISAWNADGRISDGLYEQAFDMLKEMSRPFRWGL